MFEKLESDIEKIFEKGLSPDKLLTVSEWADSYRFLTSVSSREAGQWKTERTPYLRNIMDALSANSPYNTVVFQKASQVGGTEVGINFLGYIADNTPGPTLYLMPTGDAAKDFTKTRIDPLIEETPVINSKIKPARSRDSGNTTLLKEFPGGFWGFAGSNSSVALRSKPVRFLIADETDAYPISIEGEGDPLGLAYARTRTFGKRKKIFITSSPTIRGQSRIEFEFDKTDKNYYYIPCPLCGHSQVLRWAQMRWDNDDPSTARYECEKCKDCFYNHDKEIFLKRGQWRPTSQDGKQGYIGFHISSLYSPAGWYSWSDAVQDFIECKNNPDELRVFVNTVLGETWVDRTDAPDWQAIFQRREAYKIGVVPQRCLLLTAACDVQKDRIEIEYKGWCKNLESYSVDHVVLLGDTTQNEIWERLDALLMKPTLHESGHNLHLQAVAVDSGYLSTRVYAWSRRHRTDWLYVVDGVSSDLAIGAPKLVDFNWEGKRITNGARRWPIGVNTLKRELYTKLRLPLADDGTFPDGYMHFPEYPPEFFKQLTAESLQAVGRGGRKAWKKHYERNEALDLNVYNRALSIILGLDRLGDNDWKTLEDRLRVSGGANVLDAPRQVAPARPVRRVISRGIDL